MINDTEFLEAKVRSLEEENHRLKQGLWDTYFVAAMAATLHHGKVTGVAAAAEIADEAMRVREQRKS